MLSFSTIFLLNSVHANNSNMKTSDRKISIDERVRKNGGTSNHELSNGESVGEIGGEER
jgi:hypothetical protein